MTLNNFTRLFKGVVCRLALAVLFTVLPFFVARAQEDATATETAVRLWFPYDDHVFHRSYMGNAQNLSILDNALRHADQNTVAVNLISYSSPEGNYNYNQWLSNHRASAVKKYLERTYPFLAGRISMNSAAESWDELRANVVADERLSQDTKATILDIIDSPKAPDAKERALKNLSEYRRLYSNYFSGLRYVDVALVVGTSAEATGTTTTDVTAENATAATPAEESDTAASSSASGNGRKVVYYVVNETAIRPAYMDNEDSILELRHILSGPVNVRNIVVVGAASPEGSEKYNQQLAQRRAESFVKYILDICPQAEGKIEIVNIGENWDGLREAVLDSRNLTPEQKDEVVGIIEGNASSSRKEAQLRASSAWNVIRDEILPSLRYSGITNIEFEPAADDQSATSQDILPQVDTVATQPDTTGVPDIQVDTTFTQIDTTATQIDTMEHHPTVEPEKPVVEPSDSVIVSKPKAQRYPILAVSTNLAYDAVVAPNFAVEVPIGKKWSIYGEYTFPWWLSKKNDWCYEMLKWDIGARYRLNNNFNWKDPLDVLSGHFVGLDLSAGYYDFEPRHKGYQGEFQMVSLEYGYAWNLGKNWRLDAVVGAGWMGTHYRYYEADPTDQHLLYQHHGKLNWMGPTKVGVSIKYIFTANRREGR